MNSDRYNIVCISTIDWDFLWQGQQEIMSTLARQGHRILYIENTGVRTPNLKDLPRIKSRLLNWRKGIRGIRKVMGNLYVYAPLCLPFPYSRLARFINKLIMSSTLHRWTKTMQFQSPVVWTWLPTGLTLQLLQILDPRLVVYYCIDNFEASSAGSRRIRETEDLLLKRADLVFSTSKALYERCSQFNKNVHLIPYGFSSKVYTQYRGISPQGLESVKRPILGYVGGLHKFVDLELIEKLARHNPDKSIVFVGPVQTDIDRIAGLSNVHLLGQKSYETLPAFIECFSVCLIPYLLNEYTRNVYPTKMNEYLVMGKPVVSTRLPEVEYFEQCHPETILIADGHEAFLERTREAIRESSSPGPIAHRKKIAEQNAWEEKINTINRLIASKLLEQGLDRELNWQKLLCRVYRTARQKVATLTVVCALTYALLFFSPVIWMLAEPLRSMDEPARSDVIVLLAGGIGESGEPGEAYQEKVSHGVELYRRGYASKLIFSSGIGYFYREARVMKALAVSLRVPENAIILDERGGGNYQSLLNVKRIMESEGWTRVLLVTSRYNGTRSRLVSRKHLSGITVRLTSAPRSAFFGEQDGVTWVRIRAITHEYAGILYYWWKGYL